MNKSKQTWQEVHVPSLPSNLPKEEADDYVFNSIGFYKDLLDRLDDQIRLAEDIYKNSFYKVNVSLKQNDSVNHYISDPKQ